MSDASKNPPGHEKITEIFVNTQLKNWPEKKISFEDLVKLAYPNATNKEYDVTYMKGQSNQEGELLDGDSVNVHHHMEFIVTPTNES